MHPGIAFDMLLFGSSITTIAHGRLVSGLVGRFWLKKWPNATSNQHPPNRLQSPSSWCKVSECSIIPSKSQYSTGEFSCLWTKEKYGKIMITTHHTTWTSTWKELQKSDIPLLYPPTQNLFSNLIQPSSSHNHLWKSQETSQIMTSVPIPHPLIFHPLPSPFQRHSFQLFMAHHFQ